MLVDKRLRKVNQGTDGNNRTSSCEINLGLDVLHKRVDGYHEVESIFASVDLADHLTFENLEEDIIRIETDSSFYPWIDGIMSIKQLTY